MNEDRFLKIYVGALCNTPIEWFNPPLTEEEEKQYHHYREWIKSEQEKAAKEGRQIMFDIPFDP